MHKRPVLFFLSLLLSLSCNAGNSRKAPQGEADAVEAQLSRLSLREKVGQLFSVRPEALCPEYEASGKGMAGYALREVTPGMAERAREYPVGGVVLFAHNIDNPAQLIAFTDSLRRLPGQPLLAIDEEGGRVARIGGNPNFDVYRIASAAGTGSPQQARENGRAIGAYLKAYGFDIDFAPVADVNTNPENIVIGNRAFSDRPEVAAPMVVQYLEGLSSAGIIGCLKHFPGHGDTKGDSHNGYVQTDKSWDELLRCELIPFVAGIQAGAPMVMTAHIAAPRVTGSDLPATLSPLLLQEKLRKELGFQGVIVSDALGMGAISKQYGSGEAAVLCLKAGADMLLMPERLPEAFEAVLNAVESGEISEARIDESVRRILALKNKLKRQL